MFRASDFKYREVINLSDGQRLGFVFDMVINTGTGTIEAIIVPGREKLNIFTKNEGTSIPWECIKKFGGDTILVDLPQK